MQLHLPSSAFPPHQLDVAAYHRAIRRLRPTGPLLAQHNPRVLIDWHEGLTARVRWIDDIFVVPVQDEPGQVMLVAPAGAPLSARARHELAAIVRSYRVRYLDEATAAVIGPVAAACGRTLHAADADADHLVPMPELAVLGTGSGQHHRALRRFLGDQAGRTVRVIEGRASDPDALARLLAAFDRWVVARHGSLAAAPDEIRLERAAVLRWPQLPAAQAVRCFALTIDGVVVAATALERHAHAGVEMGLLMKADPRVRGAQQALRRHVAAISLGELGPRAVWNLNQSDGLAGLDAAKRSWPGAYRLPKFELLGPRTLPTPPRRGGLSHVRDEWTRRACCAGARCRADRHLDQRPRPGGPLAGASP